MAQHGHFGYQALSVAAMHATGIIKQCQKSPRHSKRILSLRQHFLLFLSRNTILFDSCRRQVLLIDGYLRLDIATKANRQDNVIPDVFVVLEQGLVVCFHLCTRHYRCAFHQLMAFNALDGHLRYHTESTESHLLAIRARAEERAPALQT